MPNEPKHHITQQRLQELIAARAGRLQQVAGAPRMTSPRLVAMFAEQLLDVCMAYCGDELGRVFYRRMLKDTRVRAGLCVDCGEKPARRDGAMCASCQATEDEAMARTQAELAIELAPVSKAVS